MKCHQCHSTQITKNGHRRGRQCYKCKQCRRQFLESDRPWRYSDEVKQVCIKMYLNGMGLRGIERVTEIHHTTVMGFEKLDINSEMPQRLKRSQRSLTVGVLQTFVGSKHNKLWLWTAVNHKQAGILAWVIGDRSAETFKPLWLIVKCWHCFFYVTDGFVVSSAERLEGLSDVHRGG